MKLYVYIIGKKSNNNYENAEICVSQYKIESLTLAKYHKDLENIINEIIKPHEDNDYLLYFSDSIYNLTSYNHRNDEYKEYGRGEIYSLYNKYTLKSMKIEDNNSIEDYYPISTLLSLIDVKDKESLINYLDNYLKYNELYEADKLHNITFYFEYLYKYYEGKLDAYYHMRDINSIS